MGIAHHTGQFGFKNAIQYAYHVVGPAFDMAPPKNLEEA